MKIFGKNYIGLLLDKRFTRGFRVYKVKIDRSRQRGVKNINNQQDQLNPTESELINGDRGIFTR